MKKKILILASSPRKGGNSELLCDRFTAGAEEAGHAVEKIALRDRNINYCTGCGVCSGNGKVCSQKDDMTGVLEKMITSDVIVMATPVYFYTMNAQMKTVIDRTCARYTDVSNKEFYFIMTAAENSATAMDRTLVEFRGFTACLNGAKERGIICGTGVWGIGEIKKSPAMTQAYDMGKAV